jgi:hypothetical protein
MLNMLYDTPPPGSFMPHSKILSADDIQSHQEIISILLALPLPLPLPLEDLHRKASSLKDPERFSLEDLQTFFHASLTLEGFGSSGCASNSIVALHENNHIMLLHMAGVEHETQFERQSSPHGIMDKSRSVKASTQLQLSQSSAAPQVLRVRWTSRLCHGGALEKRLRTRLER